MKREREKLTFKTMKKRHWASAIIIGGLLGWGVASMIPNAPKPTNTDKYTYTQSGVTISHNGDIYENGKAVDINFHFTNTNDFRIWATVFVEKNVNGQWVATSHTDKGVVDGIVGKNKKISNVLEHDWYKGIGKYRVVATAWNTQHAQSYKVLYKDKVLEEVNID